jgi:hypothetical protein
MVIQRALLALPSGCGRTGAVSGGIAPWSLNRRLECWRGRAVPTPTPPAFADSTGKWLGNIRLSVTVRRIQCHIRQPTGLPSGRVTTWVLSA